MRIYIDTSVIGGCFDSEFAEWSNKLIKEFVRGKKIALISDQTLQELDKAPIQVKRLIEIIPTNYITMIELDEEAKELAMMLNTLLWRLFIMLIFLQAGTLKRWLTYIKSDKTMQ